MYNFLAIPTPPLTIKAPVMVEDESLTAETVVIPLIETAPINDVIAVTINVVLVTAVAADKILVAAPFKLIKGAVLIIAKSDVRKIDPVPTPKAVVAIVILPM